MSDPLKSYREEKGLTQQDVADKLGVSRALVGFWENGEREYTPDMALLIEKKLGIDRSLTMPKFFRRIAA